MFFCEVISSAFASATEQSLGWTKLSKKISGSLIRGVGLPARVWYVLSSRALHVWHVGEHKGWLQPASSVSYRLFNLSHINYFVSPKPPHCCFYNKTNRTMLARTTKINVVLSPAGNAPLLWPTQQGVSRHSRMDPCPGKVAVTDRRNWISKHFSKISC